MLIRWVGGPYIAGGYDTGDIPRYRIRYKFVTPRSYWVWHYDKTGRNGVEAGQFELMRDAKQWCEMHYATGAGE